MAGTGRFGVPFFLADALRQVRAQGAPSPARRGGFGWGCSESPGVGRNTAYTAHMDVSPPNHHHVSDSQAHAAAALLVDAFADYNARFADITRRARRRFERRDWRGAGADARARIDLYDICIRETQ